MSLIAKKLCRTFHYLTFKTFKYQKEAISQNPNLNLTEVINKESFEKDRSQTSLINSDEINGKTEIEKGSVMQESNKSAKSKTIECEHCSEKFWIASYSGHLELCKIYSNFIKIIDKEYQCILCSITLSRRFKAYNHIEKEHTTELNKVKN